MVSWPSVMRIGVAAFAALLAWGCSPPQMPRRVTAVDTHSAMGRCEYVFRFDERLERVRGEVCLYDDAVQQLSPSSPAAVPYLKEVKSFGQPLAVVDGVIKLPRVAGRRCVQYEVDIAKLLTTGSFHDGAMRVGQSALLSPDMWLWVPEPRPPNLRARVRFVTPKSMKVVVPWGSDPVIPPDAFVWMMQGAIGRLDTRQISSAAALLNIAVLDGGRGKRIDRLLGWVKKSADAVGALLRAPIKKRVQILLLPVDSGSHGLATRGGGPSVLLMMSPNVSDKELSESWTAVHELLHFTLPALRREDAWLSEGFVTYMTAVARARVGMVSEAYAWGEILDGFARGRNSGTGAVLREESATMHRNRSYWRVYWAGAAIALEIDVALRRAKRLGLDDALRKLHARRLDRLADYTCQEVLELLDEITATHIPSQTAAKYLDSAAFPDTVPLAAALGVRLLKDGNAAIDLKAPDSIIRSHIMSRR